MILMRLIKKARRNTTIGIGIETGIISKNGANTKCRTSSRKITNVPSKYPEGMEPDVCVPAKYDNHRFVIGKEGKRPLVAICMNPSTACHCLSDKTVNRVIAASQTLGYDGWFVLNIYPERATHASNMHKFSKRLHEENIAEITKLIDIHKIKEAWGAWGNLEHRNLKKAYNDVIFVLKSKGVKIFYFVQTTVEGNPKHPSRMPNRDIDIKNIRIFNI
jgi:hypothetical protein